MDYKYINQLLERYWHCETSLEEEDILRAFFSQETIPLEFLRYKAFFMYGRSQSDVLGKDFDKKVLAMTGASEPAKARVITMSQRLFPIFKAVAVVAIVFTIGNSMQIHFGSRNRNFISEYDGYNIPEITRETPVALRDSAFVDTMQQSMATTPEPAESDYIIK